MGDGAGFAAVAVLGAGIFGAWWLTRDAGGSVHTSRAPSQRFTPSWAVLGYREGGGPAKTVEWGFTEEQAREIARAKTLDGEHVYRVVRAGSKEELTARADRPMSRDESRRLFAAKKRATARWKQRAKREFAKYDV